MERANPRIAVPWSDLPPEILEKIAKRLPSEIDVRRFRSVCRSWRSATLPYKFPTIKLPFPFGDPEDFDSKHTGAYFTLTERSVYRIQLPNSRSLDFWLVKLENAENGKVRIVHPVTHRKIEILPAVKMPKVLNTLDFNVSLVCKGYALRYVNPSDIVESDEYYDYTYAKKVVFSADADTGEYVVMAIDLRSRLWRLSSGCENWRIFDGGVQRDDVVPPRFYDLASVKGLLYAAEDSGYIWAFDSIFGWKIGCYHGDRAFKRRLVELWNGDLVFVEEMGKVDGPCVHVFQVKQPFVDIAVYEHSKQLDNWVDIKATHGCIIVVGDDCSFSIPAADELKAPRVFYTDRYSFLQSEILRGANDYTCFECDCRGDICDCLNEEQTVAADDDVANDDVKRMYEGFYGHNIGVCDSETGNTGTSLTFPEYASIFWPPPAWLRRR